MSAEREEVKALESLRQAYHEWWTDQSPISVLLKAENAYRAAIETRVRAEVDAEWRARVEGMRRKIPSITPILERVTARIAGWNDALDALLTAVARDREG